MGPTFNCVYCEILYLLRKFLNFKACCEIFDKEFCNICLQFLYETTLWNGTNKFTIRKEFRFATEFFLIQKIKPKIRVSANDQHKMVTETVLFYTHPQIIKIKKFVLRNIRYLENGVRQPRRRGLCFWAGSVVVVGYLCGLRKFFVFVFNFRKCCILSFCSCSCAGSVVVVVLVWIGEIAGGGLV